MGSVAADENEHRGDEVIRVRNLTRLYGDRIAVDDIAFDVKQGEIIGLLGPNGAGKTTTMRLITGYLKPTRGEISVAGHDMVTDSLEGRRHIGYLPEIVPLYTDMTPRRYLDFVGRLHGVDGDRLAVRIDEVVSVCRLEEYVDVAIAKLSKGFRQRVGLAQAIVHDPEVLILDEPTVGIDPRQIAETRQLIRDLGKERTILLSTHTLSEVSMVCERVIIINRGRIVAQDNIEKLSAVTGGNRRIQLRIDGPPDEVSASLERIEGVQGVGYTEPFHLVELVPGAEPRSEITRATVESGWTLLSMSAVELSLEEVFLRLTEDEEAGR